MKTAILFLSFFFFSFYVFAQSCLPEGISLNSQEDVDKFPSDYPNCTSIQGDVVIGGHVYNLDSLIQLHSIEGSLTIGTPYYGGPYIDDLNGLNNIEHIGGSLKFMVLNGLKDFTGLENLKEIGGDLHLYLIYGIEDFTGFDSLESIRGQFYIYGSKIKSLSGMPLVDLSTTSSIRIYENDSLSQCHAEYMCEYLNSPSGPVNIYDNAEGCNSPAEIADACGTTLSCLPFGNYHFITQSQIDSFSSDYNNCQDIQGSISLGYKSTVTHVNGLMGIRSISGDLYLGSDSLNSLTGLDSLETIGGSLYIGGQSRLTSLNGLEQLRKIDKNLDIVYLDIKTLDGLQQLEYIGGDTEITHNDSLISISALSKLNHIGGWFQIRRNDALTELTNMSEITSVGGSLVIDHNNELMSLEGLSELSSIHGGLSIVNNQKLTSLAGLEMLKETGGLIIQNNDLKSLTGLDSLQRVNGMMRIGYNNGLSNLTGLGRLKFVERDLWIDGNKYLTSLKGLESLTRVGEWLRIVGNENLRSLAGIDNLEKIGSRLSLFDLPQLESFDGLNSLDSVGWVLGSLDNTSLSDISALSNLKIIRDLSISGSPLLTSLTGLENIQAGTLSSLTLRYNTSLSQCSIDLICDYLLEQNGYSNIAHNAEGCSSEDEIKENCVNGQEEIIKESDILIYPNPATDIISVVPFSNSFTKAVNLYDQMGKCYTVQFSANGQIKIDHLMAGLYVMELEYEKTKIRKILIVK